MFWGLLVAVLAAFFAHTRGGLFIHGFTDPKIVLLTTGIVAAWYWREGAIRTPALYRAAIAYGASIVPSLVFTKSPVLSLFGASGIYSGSVLTTGLCASGALLADRLDDDRRDTLRRVILASAALVSILCVAQVFHRDPLRWPLFGGHPVGVHGSAIDSAAILVVALSASLNPIYLLGVWATGVKSAWAGAVVALLPVHFRVWAFCALTVVGMAYCVSTPGTANQDRARIWAGALKSASWLGSGPATFVLLDKDYVRGTKTVQAHNSVFEALATRGVFGVLGLFALLAFPQMAGLWTVCAFQGVSFEVVFIACVLMGLNRKEEAYA